MMTDFDSSTPTLKHIKSLEESNKGKTKKKSAVISVCSGEN